MPPPRKAKITLDAAQATLLQGTWAGGGGFQNLGPALAGRLNPANEIELDDREVGVIVRHMSYASSGFRDRIRKIFREHLIALMNVP